MFDTREECEEVRPVYSNVLVEVNLPPKKIGNIIMTDEHRSLAGHASSTGRVVAMGETAFKLSGMMEMDGAPRIGDTVVFQQHSGTVLQPVVGGSDDFQYRVLDHEDIVGSMSWEAS